MGSWSRAFLLAVVVCAAGVSIVAGRAARATPAPPGLRVACAQKTFLVGFYPKGEPSQHKPHVKVYTKARFLGLVFPGRVSFGPACKAVRDSKTVWDGGRAKTTRKRTLLRCRIPRPAQLRAAPFVGPTGTYAGNKLLAILGSTRKVFLRATMRKEDSSLVYDPRYCARR